ncbi:alpha-2-macroglobulin-like [Rhinophrynus dorsalis]
MAEVQYLGHRNEDSFDYGLTAKLYIGLKDYESSESNVITLMDRCMTCLKSAPTDTLTLSDRAKMCYAFTVGGEFEHRETLLNELKDKAITEGGTVHLEDDETTPIFGPLFYPLYASDAVEMTAFFSMCIIDWHNVTQDDKNYGSMMAVWLVRQMTGTGGFRSPRGLAASMKALTKFAKLTFITGAHHILQIIKDNNLLSEITMDQNNRLLVQRFPLPDVPGTYILNVTGKGGCLVQCIVQYNVPVPKENASFFLDVKSSSDHCINGVAHRVTLNISYSYKGSQNKEPMAIIEVDIMSGYNSLYESLSELQISGQVAKAEEKNGKIYIFLKSVSGETNNLTIELIIGCTVLNMKDSSVYIYDPDNIDENGYASYGHPCPAE